MFKRCLFACLMSCSLGAVIPADAGTFTVENPQEIKPLKRRIRAAQFLNQATFGATSSDIDALADRMMEIGVVSAAEEWIDDQFELAATNHVPLQLDLVKVEGFDPLQTGINVARYRAHAWWHAAIRGEDQLRQRMAWALSQIFVVNRYIAGANNQTIDPSGQPRWLGIGNYYDMLVDNSFERLVKSNPSKGYIRRVATKFRDNGEGVRGDFKAVLKAILLDGEARRGLRFVRLRNPDRLEVVTRGTEHSRLKEPVVRYTQFIRAFNGTSTTYPGGYFALPALSYHWTQAAYQSPSVFNFYSPYHQPTIAITNYDPSSSIPNGSIYAPEFELMTGVTANRTANRFRADVNDEISQNRVLNNSNGEIWTNIEFDFGREKELSSDPQMLVQHLDLLLCNGTLSDESRAIIASALVDHTENTNLRARGAILAVLTSPACAISE